MLKHHKIIIATVAAITGIAATTLVAVHVHHHAANTPIHTADNTPGPGAGGGYADDDGPGLGGGYLANPASGPAGSGSFVYENELEDGYADATPGPGGSAGYPHSSPAILLADDDGPGLGGGYAC
jgi:hypothetical protein